MAITDTQIAAIEQLISLINPTEQGMVDQLAKFKEDLTDAGDECENGVDLIWLLKDVIDWDTGFFVDWKDTESFVGSINTLCEAWDVQIYWGVDDPEDDEFLDNTDVPNLMELAHAALQEHGLTLWQWDTEGDCYAGWISRTGLDDELLAISDQLDVEFRQGDEPY